MVREERTVTVQQVRHKHTVYLGKGLLPNPGIRTGPRLKICHPRSTHKSSNLGYVDPRRSLRGKCFDPNPDRRAETLTEIIVKSYGSLYT